jgi:hypothetical protein
MDFDTPTARVRRPGGRRASITGIDGANALIAVLIVVQMWLLTAALESALAGHDDAALPAAIASGILCAGCLLLFRFVTRLDRRSL